MPSTRNFFLAACLPVLLATLSVSVLGQGTSTPPSAISVEISPSNLSVEVGQKVQFSAVAKDASGNPITEKPSVWFAAPFDLAKADENGTVSFYQPGEVTVGALIGGKPAFTKVIVKPAAVKIIEIDPITGPVLVGGTLKLNATARVSTGDPRRDVLIAWSSDNPAVATVDAAGVVTGVSTGKATLKATSGSGTGAVTVNVVKASLRELSIQPRTASGRTGDVIHFNRLTQGSSDRYVPRWAVSGDGATIDSDG